SPYKKMKMPELRMIAGERGLIKFSHLRKPQLIELLESE
ncbi:unnamed protein product, partial [marine sediment metagenome]